MAVGVAARASVALAGISGTLWAGSLRFAWPAENAIPADELPAAEPSVHSPAQELSCWECAAAKCNCVSGELEGSCSWSAKSPLAAAAADADESAPRSGADEPSLEGESGSWRWRRLWWLLDAPWWLAGLLGHCWSLCRRRCRRAPEEELLEVDVAASEHASRAAAAAAVLEGGVEKGVASPQLARSLVSELPSPTRAGASSPSGQGCAAADDAAGPVEDSPTSSPSPVRGLGEALREVGTSPDDRPAAATPPAREREEDVEDVEDADDVIVQARNLLGQGCLQESAFVIFEEEGDELQHHRTRSEALGPVVRALDALAGEHERLREAGAFLNDELDRLQEDNRQAAGDLAYWRSIAEGLQEQLDGLGCEAEETSAAEAHGDEA